MIAMFRALFFPFLLLFLSTAMLAQTDSIRLTKNFQFQDGVYTDFAAFQKNQPSYSWDQVQVSLVSNPQTFLTQVEYINLINETGNEALDLNTIWGICLGGIPYVRLPQGAVKKKLTTFAGMRLRGKICYFSFEDEEAIKVKMPVYNPLTRRPYFVSDVERKKIVLHQRILRFQDGEVKPFTADNLKAWITDDERLLQTVESLTPEEVKEKLFKCLLIYVDRNPVFIEPNS